MWQRVIKTKQHTSTATYKHIADAAVAHDLYMLTKSGLSLQEARERGLNFDLGFDDPRVAQLLAGVPWECAFRQVKRQLAGAETRRRGASCKAAVPPLTAEARAGAGATTFSPDDLEATVTAVSL